MRTILHAHSYKTYSFVNKDPVIDEFRTLRKGQGVSFKDIHDDSGLSASTLRNWEYGDTRRPQNASLEAALRALGFKRVIVKMEKDESPYEKLANVKALPKPKRIRVI